MSLKEKELKLKKMMEDELESKSGHHTPEGLFTKPTQDIVDGLLKDAHGDEELALRRITFYINRAGDGLSNKTAVNAAKRELEKKVEAKAEAKKAELGNFLNEYFSEAYTNMFEDDEKEAKGLPYWRSIDVLLDNGINPYWQISMPRKKLKFADHDGQIMSLDKVYPDGSLGMLKWENGVVVGKDNVIKGGHEIISPEEFKAALEDEVNSKVVNDFNKHYYDVTEIGKIVANGDELYDAWINRFYNEHKDELGLKSPYDRKTRRQFDAFWDELSNYEKTKYAQGVSDIYGLATKDPNKGMQVGKIRFKASPRHLNGKVQKGNLEIPDDVDDPNTPFTKEYLKKRKELDNYRIDYLPANSGGSTTKVFDRLVRKQMPDGSWVEVPEAEYDQQQAHLQDIKYKPASPEEVRNRFQPEDEKIEYWLDKYKDQGIDPKFAKEPIRDASGAEWNIVKAIETHNAVAPVKFQLAFADNPDFKIIQTPRQLQDMILLYNQPKESIEEASGRFSRKNSMPRIDDYNSLYSYLEQNGINPMFCRGAKLYGNLGQIWRITAYSEYDEAAEGPVLYLQSYYRPEEGINSVSRVASNRVPLEVVQNWVKKPKNNPPEIDWEEIMLDPFLSQKAKAKKPDPDRETPRIRSFDKVAARAKHGVK